MRPRRELDGGRALENVGGTRRTVLQFNLCVGAPPPWLRPLKIGRWAAERRRAARNALSFGDADDDLDDVEEPWRVFEQP